jgi:uncharacterized membrane protein YdjX (TVP38/TMEM64 family)
MPADYQSTAKALALPVSPITSPDEHFNRPPWSRRISGATRRPQNPAESYKTQILRSAAKLQRKALKTFNALTLLQKILAVVIFIVVHVGLILFLIYNERIFGWLAPEAAKWQDVSGGWTILWLLTFFCAFPPLIGYSTTITIAGFVYGFPNGWYIVASATILGSLASFVASRTILSKYVHKLVGKDKRFEALALTLKHDGIKILCMIRLCPLPYSLSNGAMSTFPTVHPVSFALATALVSPKLLIHVFIGSRLRSIADNGGKMDPGTKAINYASIAFGSILGASVGWFIYQRTMARARELEIEELEAGNDDADPAPGRAAMYNDEDGDSDAAALMDDDDISLWDNADAGYRDESPEEEDVFASGDAGDPRLSVNKGQGR